jgi:hypothetical protein
MGLFSIFWPSGMRSGPEDFRLGRGELVVCQRARAVQLGEVFDLVGRVRRRRRILRLVLLLLLLVAGSRLVLVVAGGRLVAGSCLVVVCRLLLPGLLGLVVRYRRAGNERGTSRYARPWPRDFRAPSGTSPPRNGAGCIPRKG